GPQLAQVAEKFITGHATQPRVSDDHQKIFPGQQDLRFLRRLGRLYGIAIVAQHGLERGAHVFFVIDDEDGGKAHSPKSMVQSSKSVRNKAPNEPEWLASGN